MIKLSICIPTYNKSSDLIRLLGDINNQTVLPFEVIIQDNFSDSIHRRKIEDIKGTSKGMFKFFFNDSNIGMYPNINSLITKASGDYLVICHNDDRLSPYYVEELLAAIRDNREINIITTNISATNGNKLIDEFRLFRRNLLIKKNDGIKYLWNKGFFVFFSSCGGTCYKSEFIKRNLFNTDYGTESDLNSSLHFLYSQDIYYIDKPLYFVTMDGSNISSKIRSNRDRVIDYIRNSVAIYEKYSDKYLWIKSYPVKINVLFFMQLFFKFHFTLGESLELSGTRRYTIKNVFLSIISILKDNIYKKVNFLSNYNNIIHFMPKI